MKHMSKKQKQQPDGDSEIPAGMLNIEKQIGEYVKRYKQNKQLSQENVDIISSFIEEYLQAFILIGYNYDGEFITHAHSKSPLQSDALNTGLHKFLIKALGRNSLPPGLPHE